MKFIRITALAISLTLSILIPISIFSVTIMTYENWEATYNMDKAFYYTLYISSFIIPGLWTTFMCIVFIPIIEKIKNKN